MRIGVNLNEVSEPKPVAQGVYDLTIASVEETKTKELGKPQLRVSIGIDGHMDAPNVTHFVGLPAEGDEPSKSQFKSLMLKRFLTLFNIPIGADGSFDTDDFAGAKARAELQLSEADESTGAIYNRLVVPKMRGEAAAGRVPPPPKR